MTQTDTSKRPTVGGYCSWHQHYSRTAVPVRQPQDEGSAQDPDVPRACFPCRRAYGLVPLDEDKRL